MFFFEVPLSSVPMEPHGGLGGLHPPPDRVLKELCLERAVAGGVWFLKEVLTEQCKAVRSLAASGQAGTECVSVVGCRPQPPWFVPCQICGTVEYGNALWGKDLSKF